MTLKIVSKSEPGSLAPAHLKPATRQWFDEVVRSFELEAHHLRVLQLACESWDTYEAARDSIAKHGMTFLNKKHGDIKPRPEIAVMQNSKISFLRCLRELNLDVAPPEAPRPNPLQYAK